MGFNSAFKGLKTNCELQDDLTEVEISSSYNKWSTLVFGKILITKILRLRIEERPSAWKGAANVLNKQSRTADTG